MIELSSLSKEGQKVLRALEQHYERLGLRGIQIVEHMLRVVARAEGVIEGET